MAGREYEYLLVGAGVAAATIVQGILRSNPSASILICEAGSIWKAKDRRGWWDYVISGRHPYADGYDTPSDTKSSGNVSWDFRENRVIAYGGSTLHWGGWSLRFKPEDFHLRSNTGEGADWPFGYDTLKPYYYRAEQYLSVCGDHTESWNQDRITAPYPVPPFAWTEADGEMIAGFESLGIEPGRMPIARYRKCMATGTCKYCPVGARFTAQYILDDLVADRRHTGLQIVTEAPVSHILMHSRERAAGIEYLDSQGNRQKAFARVVIICSGTYESPKLLLLSGGKYWKQGIGNDFDLVGRFITTHSILGVRGHKPQNEECWIQEFDFPTLMSRTYDTPEYQQHGKLFIFKNRKLPNLDFAELMISGNSKNKIEARLRGPRQTELQAFLEEKGRRDNRLTIAPGKTRWGLPKTDVHFDRTASDLADANSRLALMERVIKTIGYTIDYSQVDQPGGYHSSGTCRMATEANEGVTDANLRVHGTENLYVCSNAVFPSASAVNPTLTLTALAMRLSEHLVGRPAVETAEFTAEEVEPTEAAFHAGDLNESVFG